MVPNCRVENFEEIITPSIVHKNFFKKNKMSNLDKTDKLLYKMFHSLIIWFAIYKFINGKKEFLCLFLAIFIDIFISHYGILVIKP